MQTVLLVVCWHIQTHIAPLRSILRLQWQICFHSSKSPSMASWMTLRRRLYQGVSPIRLARIQARSHYSSKRAGRLETRPNLRGYTVANVDHLPDRRIKAKDIQIDLDLAQEAHKNLITDRIKVLNQTVRLQHDQILKKVVSAGHSTLVSVLGIRTRYQLKTCVLLPSWLMWRPRCLMALTCRKETHIKRS